MTREDFDLMQQRAQSGVGAIARRTLAQAGQPVYENHPVGQISNPEPERNKTPALGGAVQGETQGVARVRVRFTGYRVRPIDPDNFAGSVKDCLDFLRHANLIDGDEPWRIILETEQEKVGSFDEERTLIEIDTCK